MKKNYNSGKKVHPTQRKPSSRDICFRRKKILECDVYKIEKFLFPILITYNFLSSTFSFQSEQKSKTWVIENDEERYAESDHKRKLNRLVYKKHRAHSIIVNWTERNSVGNSCSRIGMMASLRGRTWSIWRLNQTFLFLNIFFLIMQFKSIY